MIGFLVPFFPNHRNQQICLHNLIIRLKFIFIVSKKIFLTLWLNPFVSGSQHIESDSQINKENKSESCIDNSLKFRNFKFNRNKFYLTIFTTLCAFLGIVLLIVLSIRSNELHKQSTTGDGDDSRKNIAINSTIGYDALSCCTKWLTVTFAFFSRFRFIAQQGVETRLEGWVAGPAAEWRFSGSRFTGQTIHHYAHSNGTVWCSSSS